MVWIEARMALLMGSLNKAMIIELLKTLHYPVVYRCQANSSYVIYKKHQLKFFHSRSNVYRRTPPKKKNKIKNPHK